MSEIFKIAYTIDNKIKKLFVFCGEQLSKEEKQISNENIFTEENRKLIDEDDPEIIFIEKLIHLDDTIKTVKKKIVNECLLGFSVPEIYLFGKEEINISSEELYNALTQNDRIALTKERLLQFITQFEKIGDIQEKNIYDLNDIQDLKLDTNLSIFKPIGQHFTSITSNRQTVFYFEV